MFNKLIVMGIVLAGLVVTASAQIRNIELVAGKAATFNGQIARGGEARFIFTGKSGSALSAALSSTNKTAKFKVCEQYRIDEEIIEENRTETTVTLPETENGLYSVVVTATGAARFTLELKLTASGDIVDEMPAAGPWSVDEFFLEMPKTVDDLTIEEREEILSYTSDAIIDDDKRRIIYQTRAAGEIFEAVVFDTADRDRIFVYNEDHDPTDVARTKLVVLRCDGKCSDITAKVMPVPVNTAYKYDLPVIGKIITVRDKNKKAVYRLTWNGTKFLRNK